jgi:hypothetical protein
MDPSTMVTGQQGQVLHYAMTRDTLSSLLVDPWSDVVGLWKLKYEHVLKDWNWRFILLSYQS